MSFTLPYHRKSFRPEIDALIPGNQTADDPVEFDLAPAWGPDKARMKSVMFATMGLVQDGDWSPQTQATVIAAFETGAPAFVNTVEAIRGLNIPSVMAVRAGLLAEIPTKPREGGGMEPDPEKKFPITTGGQFAKICGAVPALSLAVALEIIKLSDKATAGTDPRFTQPRSGSGARVTRAKRSSTAPSARKPRSGTGTADAPAPTEP
jgi:hypothetical protein